MKKIRCPKCDEYVRFEESRIEYGHSLVFHCDNCGKNFTVRFKSREESREEDYTYGHVVVVENVFCKKQIIPLRLGANLFGRRSLGTEVDCPIETGDMSMDRKHCVIHVEENKKGEIVHLVEDYDSLVGTFVMNDILQKKEKRIVGDGEIITLGATTLILKKGKPE